jgi:hypothetical protein
MKKSGFHVQLHRLIRTRLYHGLPPTCKSPKYYARGLMHFASVYMTFESLWERFAHYESEDAIPLDTAMVLSGLIHLQVPELQRSQRLIDDLSTLLAVSQEDVLFRLASPEGQKLKEFLEHIERQVRAKPHVLIAYAWVFYLALFGMYERAQAVASLTDPHRRRIREPQQAHRGKAQALAPLRLPSSLYRL